MDGKILGSIRQELIDKFNAPDSKYPIFLLTTSVGGVGVNL